MMLEITGPVMIVIGYWAMILLETVGLINHVGGYWARDDSCRLLSHDAVRRDCLAGDGCCRLLGHEMGRDCLPHK